MIFSAVTEDSGIEHRAVEQTAGHRRHRLRVRVNSFTFLAYRYFLSYLRQYTASLAATSASRWQTWLESTAPLSKVPTNSLTKEVTNPRRRLTLSMDGISFLDRKSWKLAWKGRRRWVKPTKTPLHTGPWRWRACGGTLPRPRHWTELSSLSNTRTRSAGNYRESCTFSWTLHWTLFTSIHTDVTYLNFIYRPSA